MAAGLGSNQTVVVTLRLEADKANSEVAARILEQVNGAAARASQAFDTHFKKMVGTCNGFGKAMGDALSKALDSGASEKMLQRAEKAQEALIQKGISGVRQGCLGGARPCQRSDGAGRDEQRITRKDRGRL